MERETNCLKNLKIFINENPELEKFSELAFTDKFLLHFVRASKNNTREACSTVKNYILVRTVTFPQLFKTLRPSTAPLELKISRILRNPDHLNRRVSVNQIGRWNPNENYLDDILQMGVLISEEGIDLEGVGENGIVIIVDFANLGLNHIKEIGIQEARKVIHIFMKSFPLKYKEVHVLNEFYLLRALLKVFFYPLLSQKFLNRIKYHGTNMKSLHKYISKEILPKSLGGNLNEKDAFMDEQIKERILKKEEYYTTFAKML